MNGSPDLPQWLAALDQALGVVGQLVAGRLFEKHLPHLFFY
jgi:hypothetical protein